MCVRFRRIESSRLLSHLLVSFMFFMATLNQMDVRVLKHLMRQSKGCTYGLENIQHSVYAKPTFLIVKQLSEKLNMASRLHCRYKPQARISRCLLWLCAISTRFIPPVPGLQFNLFHLFKSTAKAVWPIFMTLVPNCGMGFRNRCIRTLEWITSNF